MLGTPFSGKAVPKPSVKPFCTFCGFRRQPRSPNYGLSPESCLRNPQKDPTVFGKDEAWSLSPSRTATWPEREEFLPFPRPPSRLFHAEKATFKSPNQGGTVLGVRQFLCRFLRSALFRDRVGTSYPSLIPSSLIPLKTVSGTASNTSPSSRSPVSREPPAATRSTMQSMHLNTSFT